jgi:hypothetical protein
VAGSGCWRYIANHDLAVAWGGGGYRHTTSEPGTAEAVETIRAHVAHNKAMGRARTGTGHLAAR